MEIVIRAVHSGITIVMILVLLRWLGPWIGMELEYGKFRWIRSLMDPPFKVVRETVPIVGFIDLSPVIILFGLWFFRTLLVRIFLGMMPVSHFT